MLFSPNHKFLLLKNHKVGGTSLEVALSINLPENAIVTPKTADHPAWKLKDEIDYDGYSPRNYNGFYNHISLKEVSEKVDISEVKSYVFVRNPYSSVLSAFFHRLYFIDKNMIWHALSDYDKKILLEKYFNNELGWSWLKSTKSIYTDNNTIAVDKVLKYENGVENEINPILKNHGISEITMFAKEKQFRPEGTSYQDVFKIEHLDMINLEWQWEFENLGYQYE